jgi:transcriptional regulator with PAS, ATPase and Fis domain
VTTPLTAPSPSEPAESLTGEARPSDPFDPPTQVRKEALDEPTRFGNMVGRSASMRTLFALLRRATKSDATVMIEGETGTGKEATAEAIHIESQRAKGPFVVIDCSAIPPELLESELFGNERGAFTGAVSARAGAFEAARGGTIFLDEIGELSLDLQPKILRVLERRHVKRVGSNTYMPVDVRVIAATNRSLKAEVAGNRFRSDLYYRLAVLRVSLPPLRERQADFPILVEHILHSLGIANSPEAAELRKPDFLMQLSKYHWPGNVRQLRNYIERCVALGEVKSPAVAETLAPPPLPPPSGGFPRSPAVPLFDVTQPLRQARDSCIAAFEKSYLETLLVAHGNNVAAAARAAGVDRVHLYRLLWKYGLRSQVPEGERGKR